MNQPLRIVTYGMDEKFRAALAMAFKNLGRQCATLAEESDAEVAVFNMDNVDARSMWDHFRQRFPKRPAITMSVADPKLADAVFVPKPVKIEFLIKAVNALREKVRAQATQESTEAHSTPSSVNIRKPKPKLVPVTPSIEIDAEKKGDREFCGTASDIDLANAAERKRAFYSPEKHLQGAFQSTLRLSKEKNSAIALLIKTDQGWESITCLPGVNRVVSTLDDKRLNYLSTSPAFCIETKLHRYDEAKTRKLEANALASGGQSIDLFTWKMSLWSSKGRLPQGIDLNTPMRLKRWPNFTRLIVTPGALSLAALLTDKALPVALLVRVLGIPQRQIFGFISAANALGLLEFKTATVQIPNSGFEQRQAHPHHNLFGRIVNKLKMAG